MSAANHPLSGVKALIFDIFGTVVNWRLSITTHLLNHATSKQHSAATPSHLQTKLYGMTEKDWGDFAQEWRDSYGKFTKGFVPGRDTWKTVDQHHREALEKLLHERGLDGLYNEDELHDLTMGWHKLSPWPDVVAGMQALKQHYTLGSLSNGNLSLLKDLNDYASLDFEPQHLFNAETFGAYKPHPSTYLGAVERLGLKPDEVALVAAHLGDLASARECGLRTVYVEREKEEAWGQNKIGEAKAWVDLWIGVDERGFQEVGDRLEETNNIRKG